MDQAIEVPNLEIVQVFRDVVEEVYHQYKNSFSDLPEEIAGSYRHRLAALCNSICDALIKSTTQQRIPYQGKKISILPPPKLFRENLDPLDPALQQEATNAQTQLAAVVSLAKEHVQTLTKNFLQDLKQAQEIQLPEEKEVVEMPDIAKELKACIKLLQYERDLKERTLEVLKQSKGVILPKYQPPSSLELQVYDHLYWDLS